MTSAAMARALDEFHTVYSRTYVRARQWSDTDTAHHEALSQGFRAGLTVYHQALGGLDAALREIEPTGQVLS